MQQEVDYRKLRIVDSNEPGELRMVLLETGWIQQRLKSGDMTFWTCQYHKVGITRKSTSDFLTSVNDIFAKQLEEMLEVYDICILLIENPWVWVNDGSNKMLSARGIEKQTKKGILNFIHRYQAKGFILERTANLEDTVNRLNELYAMYQRPYSLSARSKGYADERVLALPSGLRGKAGKKLLEDRTLREIANMSKEEILALKSDGIGEKRANLIFEHFNRKAGWFYLHFGGGAYLEVIMSGIIASKGILSKIIWIKQLRLFLLRESGWMGIIRRLSKGIGIWVNECLDANYSLGTSTRGFISTCYTQYNTHFTSTPLVVRTRCIQNLLPQFLSKLTISWKSSLSHCPPPRLIITRKEFCYV